MPTQKDSFRTEFAHPCVYFQTPGKVNTLRTLEIAASRAEALDVKSVVIPTTSGETALEALRIFKTLRPVFVTHSTGFARPDFQQLSSQNREIIERSGAHLLTCQHALGGVGRAVRKKLGTYQLEEILAHTLRVFGEGTKVAIEVALMASDAGLISTRKPCLSLGGSGGGVDTALLLISANAQNFFDLRVLEILAKPHFTGTV